ncbi:hypothetical protein GE09DRAFT_168330 [Coniochaeta sp. 2T2.1]|nr:hypothetical protein GE09DRAFT_168330 [Coniochaeta sp. 2T2.1]
MRVRLPCLLREVEHSCDCRDIFIEFRNLDDSTAHVTYTQSKMGDPLSTVASGIALVQAAGGVVKIGRALCSLGEDMKDVPERIGRLLKSTECMMVIFAGIERHASTLHRRLGEDDQLVRDTVELAHKAAVDLKLLVSELERDVDAKRRTRRLPARVKVVLKESELAKYESRLQNALGLLSLAQQSYSMVHGLYMSDQNNHMMFMLQTILTRTDVPATRTQKEKTEESSNGGLFDSGEIKNRNGDRVAGANKAAVLRLELMNEVHTIRFKSPKWLTQKAWEVGFSRSILGWQLVLRVYNTMPYDSDVFRLAYEGKHGKIAELFEKHSASPLDIDADGWTLLDWAITGPSSIDSVKFLYDIGVRPRKHNGDRVSPLTGLAKHGDTEKFRFALSLGYHEPADESARQYTASMVLAAATDDEMFDAALAAVSADDYYSIPLWIRLSYLPANTPLSTVRRVVSRYSRQSEAFIPIATQQLVEAVSDSYPLLDVITNSYWDLMHCIVEARTVYSQFQPGSLSVLQHSWEKLKAQVAFTTSNKSHLAHPEGDLSVFSVLRTWDCPSLGAGKRENLLSAIKAWLEALQRCGVDLTAYSNNVLDLLNTRLSDDGPWDRQWCHWCQMYGPDDHRGFKLLRLEASCGPDVLAWDLVWDVEVEEYVGEFWDLVDKSGLMMGELQIPGAWVE